jgi:hypothetical protein
VSAPLHGTVFISDDPFPLRRGRPPGVHCHWEGERDGRPVFLEDGPAGLNVEGAVAWGRERAPLVLVRLGGSRYFSAGTEDPSDEALPRWPPSAEALAEIAVEVRAVLARDARRAALAAEVARLPFRLPPRLRGGEGGWTAHGSSLAPPDAGGVMEVMVCEQPIQLWALVPGRFACRSADGKVREGALVDLIAAAAELPADDEHVAGLAAIAARELASA